MLRCMEEEKLDLETDNKSSYIFIQKNKNSGHRRFYCNERGFKKLREFFDEQWGNNIGSKD